jgi:hypothetical protein
MLLTIAFVGVGWALPAVLLAAGVLHRRGTRAEPPESTDWQLLVFSTLLCTIAFNLTFFLQELFLVLPKALVPGLVPTLYHNDHEWTGRAPIAELFEGMGAVAILISGLISKFAFERVHSRSPWRPFALWMAFEGLFQALPQFVLGAIIPGNDIGRAYAYLHFSSITRSIIALVALFAIPCAGIWIGRSFISLSPGPAAVQSWRGRAALLAQLVGIPAVASVPLIVAFRVPREIVEVVLLPLLVELMGGGWVLAAAWTRPGLTVRGSSRSRPVLAAAVGALVLLTFFQLVLRHGIRFY